MVGSISRSYGAAHPADPAKSLLLTVLLWNENKRQVRNEEEQFEKSEFPSFNLIQFNSIQFDTTDFIPYILSSVELKVITSSQFIQIDSIQLLLF